MKRLMYVLFFVLLTSGMAYAQQAKYVFYFIGDGMGVNQVNGTEMYLAEQEGRIGVKPLLFTSFPVASMATTFSATNSVTDSSAAGTALATGVKTYNGAIGMDDNKSVLQSVAERAKKSGKKVGVTTSVSVDHATPAAFYAHQPDRGMYYEIAIDRQEGDLTLAEITESAISFLTKGSNKGFFLMVEGGKIDWACHGNDPATAFEEVVDMDNAIKVAYEFYKKHPKETLIVVTADHETGGLGLGTGKYELQLKALAKQKQSQEILSRSITDLRKMRKVITWPEMKEFLAEKMGFWKELPVSWEQEKMLRDAYEESFVNKHVVFEESLYAKTEPLAVAAKKVMSQIAMVGWTSGGHTAGYVPVFAVGAGSKLFVGKMDNTEIPKRIAKAGGYK